MGRGAEGGRGPSCSSTTGVSDVTVSANSTQRRLLAKNRLETVCILRSTGLRKKEVRKVERRENSDFFVKYCTYCTGEDLSEYVWDGKES